MLKAKIKNVEDALSHAKLYLKQGIVVTITPTVDGYYMIEKKLNKG